MESNCFQEILFELNLALQICFWTFDVLIFPKYRGEYFENQRPGDCWTFLYLQ